MSAKAATALTLFDQSSALAIPAHISALFDDDSNIEERVSIPSLGYEGKVWQISLNGEKTKLVKRNEEGDEEPLATMRVVVLDYAKRRGRAYYEGAYDPGKIGKPICASDDGITPNSNITEPQHPKCEGCQWSVKGSKVSEQGKAVTACSQHRMIAVVPSTKLDFTPLRLKIAITSDYDKQSPELEAQGWFGFSNYIDLLRAKGVQHTAGLVTKMKFDPNAAYPKVMFAADRWLTPEEVLVVSKTIKSDAVKALVEPHVLSNEAKAHQVADSTAGITASQVAEAVEEAPAPKAAPRAAPKAAPKAAPAPAPAKPAAAPKMLMDDDEAPAKPATPKVSATVPEDLTSLLAEWGED